MKRGKIRIVLITICFISFIFSVYKVVSIIEVGNREEKRFEELRQTVKDDIKSDDRHFNIDFNKLHNENKDFVSWLKIPNTPIDYPVMNTPSNPNYYLRRDFHRKRSMSGTLFVGEGAGVDTRFVIIYGHNMNNSSMFGTLDNYKNKEFYAKHRDILLSTESGVRRYKVVGAFDANLNTDKFKYYDYYGDVLDEDFDMYMSLLSRYSLYPDYRDISNSDQILMLSTCSDRTGPERFVVVAKRIK